MPHFRSARCAAATLLWLTAAGTSFADVPALPAPAAPLEQMHPLVGQIVTSSGRLTPRQLAERAAASDVVLLGEKHDNPDHHRLQAWVIEAMVALGQRPAIAMEMLDADQAASLTAYRKKPGADAAGLGAAVGWQARGWPDWTTYAPIAVAAFGADLPIVPADLTRTQIRAVGRGGLEGLEPGLANELESSPRFDAAQGASLEDELRASHCGQLPETALPRMMDVPWARDANLARMLRAAGRSVLIAGAGHVRTDRGVAWHLRRTVPEQKVLSVAFIEVQADRVDPAAYVEARPYDVLWFTPRVDNEDPCVAFRESLKRARKP